MRPLFHRSEFQVRRRYQDFLWLRNELMRAYPDSIVPVCASACARAGRGLLTVRACTW